MLTIYNIISGLILYFISYNNITYLLKQKPKLISSILSIIIIILSLCFTTIPQFIVQTIILTILFYNSTKTIKQTINAIIYNQLLIITLDIISLFLAIVINGSYQEIPYIFMSPIIISLSYLLIRYGLFSTYWKIIQTNPNFFLLISICILSICTYSSIKTINNIQNIGLIIIGLLCLITKILKEQIKFYSLEKHLNNLTKLMEIYEKQLEEERIIQHEYKNTLIYISTLAPENKKIQEYISELLNQQKTVDYILLNDMKEIKIDSLKGVLYMKLVACKKENINVTINVSSDISYNKIKNLGKTTSKTISSILSILLDNAIESAKETEEKSLSIYIYQEQDNVFFQLSNTFSGTININLLYKKGYSTKGKKRGYGLYLIKEWLKKNPRLSLNSKINKDIFTQTLILNLKNTKSEKNKIIKKN